MTVFNYTVNYVDVIIVGIILLFMIIGWARGIFITVVNLIRYAVGFFLCTYCSNNLAQPIYDGFVKEKIVDTLAKKVVTSANIDEISTNLTQFVDNLPDIVRNNVFTTRYDSFACVSGMGYVFRNNAFFHQSFINISGGVRHFRFNSG